MPQPFITLRLVGDDSEGGAARRINLNAAHIVSYSRWKSDNPGSDYRAGVANTVVTLANGNQFHVRETPAEVESALVAV